MRNATLCWFKRAASQSAHVPSRPPLPKQKSFVPPDCIARLIVECLAKSIREFPGKRPCLLSCPQGFKFMPNHGPVRTVFVARCFVASCLPKLSHPSALSQVAFVRSGDCCDSFLANDCYEFTERSSPSSKHFCADFANRLLDFTILVCRGISIIFVGISDVQADRATALREMQ